MRVGRKREGPGRRRPRDPPLVCLAVASFETMTRSEGWTRDRQREFIIESASERCVTCTSKCEEKDEKKKQGEAKQKNREGKAGACQGKATAVMDNRRPAPRRSAEENGGREGISR